MSDCHDKTREERIGLVAVGRALLERALLTTSGEPSYYLGPLEQDDACRLLDRALDAIEYLDRQAAEIARQEADEVWRRLRESPSFREHVEGEEASLAMAPRRGTPAERAARPTLAVGLGTNGIEWQVK